jgi:hypothetical protein
MMNLLRSWLHLVAVTALLALFYLIPAITLGTTMAAR